MDFPKTKYTTTGQTAHTVPFFAMSAILHYLAGPLQNYTHTLNQTHDWSQSFLTDINSPT
jgi:hypothetical protein